MISIYVKSYEEKLDEYFKKNFILNKRYFSVKSIMLIFGYFFINLDYYMDYLHLLIKVLK